MAAGSPFAPTEQFPALGCSLPVGRCLIETILFRRYNVFTIRLTAGVLVPIGFLLSPAVDAWFMSLVSVIVAINARFLRRVDLTIPNLPGVSALREPQPAD
jgi:hypothetical protein